VSSVVNTTIVVQLNIVYSDVNLRTFRLDTLPNQI